MRINDALRLEIESSQPQTVLPHVNPSSQFNSDWDGWAVGPTTPDFFIYSDLARSEWYTESPFETVWSIQSRTPFEVTPNKRVAGGVTVRETGFNSPDYGTDLRYTNSLFDGFADFTAMGNAVLTADFPELTIDRSQNSLTDYDAQAELSGLTVGWRYVLKVNLPEKDNSGIVVEIAGVPVASAYGNGFTYQLAVEFTAPAAGVPVRVYLDARGDSEGVAKYANLWLGAYGTTTPVKVRVGFLFIDASGATIGTSWGPVNYPDGHVPVAHVTTAPAEAVSARMLVEFDKGPDDLWDKCRFHFRKAWAVVGEDVDFIDPTRDPAAQTQRATNVLANPVGALGIYGWEAPESGTSITSDGTSISLYGVSSNVAGSKFYSSKAWYTPWTYVAARLTMLEATFWPSKAELRPKLYVQFLDASGVVLSEHGSTERDLLLEVAPVMHTSATYIRLKIDLGEDDPYYSGTLVNSFLRFTDAMLATSTELDLQGMEFRDTRWVNILGKSTELNISRKGLDVGTLSARVLSDELDPGRSDAIRPGRRVRVRTVAEPVYEEQTNYFGFLRQDGDLWRSDAGGGTLDPGVSVTPGVQYTFAARARITDPNIDDCTLFLRTRWYDSLGRELYAAGGVETSAVMDITKPQVILQRFTAPAGAYRFTVEFDSNSHINGSLYIDHSGVVWEEFTLLVGETLAELFDGNTGATWDTNYWWNGPTPAFASATRRKARVNESSLLFQGRIDSASTEYVPRTVIQINATDAITQLANSTEDRGIASVGSLPYILAGKDVAWNCNGNTGAVSSATIVSYNDNASALDQIVLCRDSVLGYAWVDRRNVVQVWDASQISSTVKYVIDEDVYAIPYVSFNTVNCINDVRVKWLRYASGQTSEIAYGPYVNLESVRDWGYRTAEFTIHGTSENSTAIQNYATSILAANANPAVRINAADIPVRSWEDIYNGLPQLDLYDLVEVRYAGTGTVEESRITSVEHNIVPDKWTMRLGFDPVGGVALPRRTPRP